MSVGDNIKKRRFELKMSQQELADALGYKTRSTIAKIESGENDVSHKKLLRFAAVLDTTVESLVSGFTAQVQSAGFIDRSDSMRNVVIILAGSRVGVNGQSVPTQFINVHGKPIIVYSMGVYQQHPSIDDIYVVCVKGWESILKDYALQFGITKLKGVIPAGSSGIISLKNALEYIKDEYAFEDTIIIQESTRPIVTVEMVSKLLQVCSEKKSATIGHSMRDYVQFDMSEQKPKYIDRDNVIALQSPEAHSLALLNEVFDKARSIHHALTESCCTMLLYNLGYEINFIEGNTNNIKIAREEDVSAFASMVR